MVNLDQDWFSVLPTYVRENASQIFRICHFFRLETRSRRLTVLKRSPCVAFNSSAVTIHLNRFQNITLANLWAHTTVHEALFCSTRRFQNLLLRNKKTDRSARFNDLKTFAAATRNITLCQSISKFSFGGQTDIQFKTFAARQQKSSLRARQCSKPKFCLMGVVLLPAFLSVWMDLEASFWFAGDGCTHLLKRGDGSESFSGWVINSFSREVCVCVVVNLFDGGQNMFSVCEVNVSTGWSDWSHHKSPST